MTGCCCSCYFPLAPPDLLVTNTNCECSYCPICCDVCISVHRSPYQLNLQLAADLTTTMYGAYGPDQPYPFYQQQYRSQPQLRQAQPRTLQKKPSAWMSTPEVNVAQVNPAWTQEQSWQPSNQMVASQTGILKECWSSKNVVPTSISCDNVAERLHKVLCRADVGDDNENNLEALTRELSLDDTQPTSTTRGITSKQGKQTEDRSKGLFSAQKAWMYANSRLPPYIPPFKAYLETWQLFLRAANASVAAYNGPGSGERKDYVQADSRQGTKAMVLKSITMDDKKLIVIAIRGSQWNCRDWAVNFDSEPSPPDGFLDDSGNACHAGFLQVARSMVVPVANRLRELLEQAPNRLEGTSLLFTGHSAGGAVASLLYMHMFSKKSSNPLSVFDGIFKRIHCVTFGVPPISLLPLQKPNNQRYKKNLFISFVNEGDPIVRADRRYMKSLVRLYATSAPKKSVTPGLRQKMSRQVLKGQTAPSKAKAHAPIWEIPDATLSNAGRIVVLRETPGKSDKVEAVSSSDGELRGLVFGDPMMHHMDVYQRRINAIGIDIFSGDAMR